MKPDITLPHVPPPDGAANDQMALVMAMTGIISSTLPIVSTVLLHTPVVAAVISTVVLITHIALWIYRRPDGIELRVFSAGTMSGVVSAASAGLAVSTHDTLLGVSGALVSVIAFACWAASAYAVAVDD